MYISSSSQVSPNSFTSTSCTCCLLKQLAGVQGTNNRQTAGKSITPTTQQLKHTHTYIQRHTLALHTLFVVGVSISVFVCLCVCVCARDESSLSVCAVCMFRFVSLIRARLELMTAPSRRLVCSPSSGNYLAGNAYPF